MISNTQSDGLVDSGSALDDDHRLITAAGAKAIYERLESLRTDDGIMNVAIEAWWRGELRWARNQVTVATDIRDIVVNVYRRNRDGSGSVITNQVDVSGLTTAVKAAERKMAYKEAGRQMGEGIDGLLWAAPALPFPDTTIWSDTTYRVTPDQRGVLARALTEEATKRDLLSAGYLQMRVYERQNFGGTPSDVIEVNEAEWVTGEGADRVAREVGYQVCTESQCSMTVRHPKGIGSGWAGLSSYDWGAIDAQALAVTALDKCVKSLNPVAIEPGRYTVILEPQATAEFARSLVGSMGDRLKQENPQSPGVWSLDVDPSLGLRMTKLGLQVVDERLTIRHDPMDPRLGIVPQRGLREITWIEHGVLKTLSYNRGGNHFDYALPMLGENLPELSRSSFVMSGGETTMEEMISTTKRGILVSRFSGVRGVPNAGLSVLMTGLTRDGLWLIENGKIAKAVKNMRFTDSPLFVFNQLEQLGRSVPVFNPSVDRLSPVIVPPIKARDFAFTATIDAV